MQSPFPTTAMYFSPTGTTRRIVCRIAREGSRGMSPERAPADLDFTLPATRTRGASFLERDLVVFGVPVYAGRVPKMLLEYLSTVHGNGALAVAVVVYGNRDYGDALLELTDLLEAQGFIVTAAAAFIGEHSYSRTLAQGRPDADDLTLATRFADRVSAKLAGSAPKKKVLAKGARPYREMPRARNEKGELIDLSQAKPQTSSACLNCKRCLDLCPVGSINRDDVSRIEGICIRCNACVKLCPAGAKSFSDSDYLFMKNRLETHCTQRREPEFFL